MAFAFIGLGIPFMFCLIGIPVAVVLIYVGVWSAHMFKVTIVFFLFWWERVVLLVVA